MTRRRRRNRHRDSEPRSWFGNLVAAVIGLALALGLAEGAARILFPRWAEFDSARFITTTKVEGWPEVPIGRPGFDGWFSQNNGDFRAHVHINDFGLRDLDPVAAADGRLWEVGDSFTFGWGVANEDSFGAVAATRLGLSWYSVASPGTDVCGYRTLLARMPKEVRPKAVVLGLTIENDLMEYDCAARQAAQAGPPLPETRSFRLPPLIWFKHGLMGASALYNFVAVSAKQVSSLESLLVGLHIIAPAAKDQRQFPEERLDAVLDSTAAEIGRLHGELAPGTPLVVLIIPGRLDLMNGDSFYRAQRQGLVSRLGAMGIAVADPFPLFEPEGAARIHFAHDGHWSTLGHRLAGEAAAARLAELTGTGMTGTGMTGATPAR